MTWMLRSSTDWFFLGVFLGNILIRCALPRWPQVSAVCADPPRVVLELACSPVPGYLVSESKT